MLSAAAAACTCPSFAQQVYSPDRASGVETVVVTASPIAKGLDASASITTQVDRSTILDAAGGNIADALANVPGVSGSGFAAGASRPIIRGMDASRVKLVEDGLSSSDVSDIGPDHGVPLDPLSTQQIEVVRGAATLRYGSQALGGVINAINNRVPTALPEKTMSTEVSGTYGSSANTGEGSVMTDIAAGNFAIHADGFYRTAGNYDTPNGTQANSFFVGNGFSAGSTYFFGNNSHTGAAVIQYDGKYGIPSDTTYILMRQTKFLSRSSFDVGAGPFGALNVDASYANYSHEEKNPDGSVNTTFKNKELDAHIEQLIGAIGPISNAAVGLQVQNRGFSAIGQDSSYLFPTQTNSVAGYIFADSDLSKTLHLETSARIENVRITGTPASDVRTTRDYTPVSGAIGLLYDASDFLKLGLTASSAGRAPAQTELFARGGHDGPQTYETGDPTLKIERSNSLEGTARLRLGKFNADFSAWSSWFDNYIYGALNGQSCSDDGVCSVGGGDLRELFYRQQGAHFWGLEGKGSLTLYEYGSGGLVGTLQGDFVRATLNDGSNVPRIPAMRIGWGLAWESDQFDLGVNATAAGKQTDAGAFDTATGGYTELNAKLAWRPMDGYQIELIGHNLTNAEERNAAAFNKDLVVAPGRDIRVVLTAKL
nr:TonB-dependent receptor [Rhizomicrobium palustre]